MHFHQVTPKSIKLWFENQVLNQEGKLEDIENSTNDAIKTTIPKLKNRKAQGLNGITNEMLKYGGEKLIEELHHPKNYRGISLSAVLKLLTKLYHQK